MANNFIAGQFGENLALNYLLSHDYVILATNWRYKHWEVDIVCQDGDYLVFVEVKSRKYSTFGAPSDFVDDKKQKNLIRAADAYIELNNYEGEIRFDIVSVYLNTNKIELIKDAFWSE